MELAYYPQTPQQALTYNKGRHQRMEIGYNEARTIQLITYAQPTPIAQENMHIDDMATYHSLMQNLLLPLIKKNIPHLKIDLNDIIQT